MSGLRWKPVYVTTFELINDGRAENYLNVIEQIFTSLSFYFLINDKYKIQMLNK